ncbi:hypothetical protein UFOVP1383_35 [uncultured Caudovirales phage]|uniref:Uncharacterized protein n=1 Tax=uncultured Caudovirales phage TaxID=2100421 RepID=A0A6J5S6N9_9CAUD|nr:hypothetical protein UFOVP848_6 [uncultured Caudovirales phage]CAB4173417.1 hypothetical protein UFOVP945_59 [uncultured Caudovirales phage]CAB4179667.1 hypothetical protein UFOVP1023_42 [uncultured Caudovirales phage]CAB4204156.1 hypothetical protein UFOVP1383_35 [uncultured Caudovirales phage]CAB4215853.1 hypothetical protein UFOVP1477_13 [uncultured Caudovirales phage]
MAEGNDELDFTFDLDAMTVADVEVLEEVSGFALANMDFKSPPARLVRAMVYLAGRRQDPTFTLEDAGAVKLSQLASIGSKASTEDAASADEPDPTRSPGGGGAP